MKKQIRGLNRYNMLQDEKKRGKQFQYICVIHFKLTVKKKLKKKGKKKTTTKNGLNGIRTPHPRKKMAPSLYNILKTERSIYCGIESLENYM